MKKILELTILAVTAIAVTGLVTRYDLGGEMVTALKSFIAKCLPWFQVTANA